MGRKLAAQPGASFSAACGEALRKSADRLFSYEDLDLMATHRHRTHQRISEYGTVLLIEDTTDLVYKQSNKQGMGPLGGPPNCKVTGLNLHSAVALTEQGLPLGIVSHHCWAPCSQHKGVQREKIPIEQKESYKWIRTIEPLNQLALQYPNIRFIKIGDREADFFEHYSWRREPGAELLIRLREKQRNVFYNGQAVKVGDLNGVLPIAGTGKLSINRKGKTMEREVSYQFGQIQVPPTARRDLEVAGMQVVIVTSIDGDNNKEPLEWLLITTLPVSGLDDCVRMAVYYALRWTIERYHLILKSGLGAEKTQIQSARRIGYALELWAVVGWWVLLLMRMGRLQSDELASDYFESDVIEVLEATARDPIKTVGDVVKAVGILGGFRPSKRQPMPGERTLWTGVRLLAAQIKAYHAARKKYGTG